jgi:hypothetical protein
MKTIGTSIKGGQLPANTELTIFEVHAQPNSHVELAKDQSEKKRPRWLRTPINITHDHYD